MRISDWSSDVCSSDLRAAGEEQDAEWNHPEAEHRQEAQHAAADQQHTERPAQRCRRLESPTIEGMGLSHRLRAVSRLGHCHACSRFPPPASVSGKRRSEEHTSELQSLMRLSYAVFCLKKKTLNE